MSAPAHAAAVLALAVGIDVALGEYPAPLHPVVWMGRTLTSLERLAPASGPGRQLLYGAFLALAIPSLFAAGALVLAALTVRLGPASIVVEAVALKSTFAVRELGRAAARVRRALQAGDLEAARDGLRSLCSRDPSRLDAGQIAAAAVESVAENASDSAVAPVLFYAAFGLPGAFFYRAANTLDARIGYHGNYEWLGKPAARLDDLLNLVPARLTALLLLAAGVARGGDARRGWRILRRDGASTESPNAGRPMAAMAGLLGVELVKIGHYALGDPGRPVGGDTIQRAWSTAVLASLLAVGLSLAALGALDGLRG